MKAFCLMLTFMVALIMPSISFAQISQDDLVGFRNNTNLPSDIFDGKTLVSLGSRLISSVEKSNYQIDLALPNNPSIGQLLVLSPSNQLIVNTNCSGGQISININTNEIGAFRYAMVTNTTIYLGEVMNL